MVCFLFFSINNSFAYSIFTANADLVRVSLYAASATVGGDNWSAGDATRNFLNLGQKYRIRQNGTIEQVRFYAGKNATAPNLTEFLCKNLEKKRWNI